MVHRNIVPDFSNNGDVWIYDNNTHTPILVSTEDLQRCQSMSNKTILSFPTEQECWEANE